MYLFIRVECGPLSDFEDEKISDLSQESNVPLHSSGPEVSTPRSSSTTKKLEEVPIVSTPIKVEFERVSITSYREL